MKLNGDYLEDMAQLEQCDCYSWGENLLLVKDEYGDRYLVNKETGKARQISTPGFVVGFIRKVDISQTKTASAWKIMVRRRYTV